MGLVNNAVNCMAQQKNYDEARNRQEYLHGLNRLSSWLDTWTGERGER